MKRLHLLTATILFVHEIDSAFATAVIHGAFLFRGAAPFRTAPSLAVIAAAGVSGAALILAALPRRA